MDRVTIILSRIMATTPRLNSSCQKDDGVIPILLDRVTIILSRIMAATPRLKYLTTVLDEHIHVLRKLPRLL